MGVEEEQIPEDRIFHALVEDALVPTIRAYEKDLGRRLLTDVVVMAGGMRGPSMLISTGEEPTPEDNPDGEIRIRLRPGFQDNRLLWRADAVYQDVDPASGFSGFLLRGDVQWQPESVHVECEAVSTKYNDREWRKWR